MVGSMFLKEHCELLNRKFEVQRRSIVGCIKRILGYEKIQRRLYFLKDELVSDWRVKDVIIESQ